MYLYPYCTQQIMPIFLTYLFSCMIWEFSGRFRILNSPHFHLVMERAQVIKNWFWRFRGASTFLTLSKNPSKSPI